MNFKSQAEVTKALEILTAEKDKNLSDFALNHLLQEVIGKLLDDDAFSIIGTLFKESAQQSPTILEKKFGYFVFNYSRNIKASMA